MADKVPGQCERCVPILCVGDEWFVFCDSSGVPAIEIGGLGRTEHYGDAIDTVNGCSCATCVRCWVICYRLGLISKALMDRLSTERGVGYRVRDALRESRSGL
jgi:hypothetical protein